MESCNPHAEARRSLALLREKRRKQKEDRPQVGLGSSLRAPDQRSKATTTGATERSPLLSQADTTGYIRGERSHVRSTACPESLAPQQSRSSSMETSKRSRTNKGKRPLEDLGRGEVELSFPEGMSSKTHFKELLKVAEWLNFSKDRAVLLDMGAQGVFESAIAHHVQGMQHVMALADFINVEGRRHIEADGRLAELEKEQGQLKQQVQGAAEQIRALEQLNFTLAQTASAREAEVRELHASLEAKRKKGGAVDSLRSEVGRLNGELNRCYVETRLELLREVRDGAISSDEILEEIAELEKSIPPS